MLRHALSLLDTAKGRLRRIRRSSGNSSHIAATARWASRFISAKTSSKTPAQGLLILAQKKNLR